VLDQQRLDEPRDRVLGADVVVEVEVCLRSPVGEEVVELEVPVPEAFQDDV
jgi:hypothetical protein